MSSKVEFQKKVDPQFHGIYQESKDPNKYQKTLYEVFKKKLEPLYGDQKKALASILNRSDRVGEILVNEADKTQHLGLIVYKKELQDEFKPLGIAKSLELKTLIVVDSEKNSGKGYGSLLLERIKRVATNKLASGIHVTVSEEAKGSLPFFQKKGFQIIKTWEGKFKKDIKEHLLYLKLNPPVKTPALEPKHDRGVIVPPHKRKHPESSSSSNPVHEPILEKKGPKKEPFLHQATLKKVYIHQIRNEAKTVEGRIDKGAFYHGKFRKGDHIRFYYQADPKDDVLCEITAIHTYKSFEEMLKDRGVKNCVPDAKSLSDGVRMYHVIPGYEDNSKKHGVVAICLKKLK